MEALNSFLSNLAPTFNVEDLINTIYKNMQHKSYHHRLHYKKYDNNLIQLFSESSQEYTKWDIYNVCRSIIFSQDTGKIISFSHPNIEYLTQEAGLKYLVSSNTFKFTESHEGTLISVFFYNDKWYYATRREIDMYKTHKYVSGIKSELSHGQMFEECLSRIELTKDQFESKLDKQYQYYFELVHYDNIINISYESKFGDKYAKLFLLFVRNGDNQKVNVSLSEVKIESSPELTLEEVNSNLSSNVTDIEGYIFEADNHLCKIMHNNYYDKMKYNPGYKTKQEQYIHLYQKNLLVNKVYNDKESEEFGSVETVGLLNAVITYIGQRMLDIYYTFNNNNMMHKKEDEFKRLFMDNHEYNIIFYTLGKMKGIHKNRQLTLNEMRKFLKYYMNATDIWKLGNCIREFESNEELLKESPLKIVKLFFE
jgi:hypothetical protein